MNQFIKQSVGLMILCLALISCQKEESNQENVFKLLHASELKYTDESVPCRYCVPLDRLLGFEYNYDHYFDIPTGLFYIPSGQFEIKFDFVKNKSKIDSLYIYESMLKSYSDNIITKLPNNDLVSSIPIIQYANVTQIDKDWYSVVLKDDVCIIRIKRNLSDKKRFLFVGLLGKAITANYDGMVGNIEILQY
ncbi:MAG: hypothetical protein EOM31_06480 [Bacteroidia bacterium]|nr:hypothetical protein [Bacteroidia bacterium]